MKRQIIRVEPHANTNPHRKRREDQIPRLREEAAIAIDPVTPTTVASNRKPALSSA